MRTEPEVPVADPTTGPTPSPARPRARGPRKRKPKLNDDERKLRGEMMLAQRIKGFPTNEIAKEFNLSESTVYRVIGEVRRGFLFERARDHIAGTLLPLALATYEHHLNELNVEVARDILQGLGLAGRQVAVKVEHDVKEDFDAWRLKRTASIDATVIESSAIHAEPSTDPSPTPPAGDALPIDESPTPEPAPLDSPVDREADDEDSMAGGGFSD